MKNILIFFCGWLWVACASAASVTAATDRLDLAGAVQVLEDRSGSLSLADVSSPPYSGHFTAWPEGKGDPNFGFTHSAFWLRIPLQRSAEAPDHWLLQIPVSHISSIEFDAPERPPVLTGSERALKSRPFFDRYFVFPVTLETAPRYVYLRVASRSALTVPLVLWSQPALNAEIQHTLMLQGMYFGGTLVLFLYNLFLFGSLRDGRFLLYALYVMSLGMGTLAGNGLGMLFIWSDHPAFDEVAEGTFLSLAASFGVLFASRFLLMKEQFPGVHRVMVLASFVLAGNVLAFLGSMSGAWSPEPFSQSTMLVTSLAGALIMATAVRAMARKIQGARFFLLAWGILWLGILLAVLRAFDWVPTNLFTSYCLQISSAMEMLLLALALADIIHAERAAREAAQRLALETHASLVQTLQSSEETLEGAVRERTEQLRVSLEQQKEVLAQYVRFGSMISHEFRNPLGIIGSQLSLLRKEQERGEPRLDRHLPVMDSATRRLTQMFEKWLQSDRLGHSLEDISIHPMCLEQWLRQLLDGDLYCLEGHPIELCFPPQMPLLEGDEYLLEIAVTNLLDNAAKYSPVGAPIRVEVRGKPGWLGIAVIDRGPGIAPEHQEQIFSEFFRVQPEGKVRGLGLGLSIVKRIVAAHGGHIQLESAPGGGSGFCLWLPCGRSQGPASSAT